MKIADIKVGRRHRKTYGDIPALAASIEAIGLLHPVVVTAEGRLVAGHRRVLAMQHLGRDEVAATVVNNLDEAALALAAERDENTCRLNFLPTEAVALGEALERIERPKAEERQRKHGGTAPGRKKNTAGKLPPVKADTRDVVGKATGTSGKTYERAKAVVEAAKADPERFGRYADAMDKTGKVNGAYKAMQRAKTINAKPPAEFIHEESSSSLEDFSMGDVKFPCIYADPPWQYGNQSTRAATDNHYPTMSLSDICSLPIAKVAAENAHLHLWTTNAFLFDAKKVIEAWGFEYKSVMVWVKPQMGIGNYWRVSHEFLLLATRGRLPFQNRAQMSWAQAERTTHSSKPDLFRRKIELVSPAPRLELFARIKTPGWSSWGNDISSTLYSGESS